ncbi:DUF1479-domain-containing protein [Guyanagaster necrorhizus]|uniref:DUF1479-domain-containing protein n=1 Tax=Guyanagaster necrorhizus TaxID=856835 RepID=A0A9P7VQD3_9AGAR|nr:DUF1479-domain-containing protein [Guyanagaster necrorhizus MCA 3950]KAG7444743.1 DUF1479-domain-containing protein [Guyanagaster necrorhizus MCA 3950]
MTGPADLLKLKAHIAASYPDFEANVTKAWKEVIDELAVVTETISEQGANYLPQLEFADLSDLTEAQKTEIKSKGCVVIRNVIEDQQAITWRHGLQDFVAANPDVEGFPSEDKQFSQLFWTKPQIEARAHPNMLRVSTWLNQIYHYDGELARDGAVDLSEPLSYADRLRMRHPGVHWDIHPPHVDGGAIERWEDPSFRSVFKDIFEGNWKKHDPYDLRGRINAKSSLHNRVGQATIFRTFQGWLAISKTAPTEGTIQFFPNVIMSNVYIMLRPFFRPLVPADSPDILKAESWQYDISTPDFPGIIPRDSGYTGPRPTPDLHPHLRLEKTMISVPKVLPGDTVFWHCDMVHAVEAEHTGKEDSCVMYIPSVPLTPMNKSYIERQRDSFLKGIRPPDFPPGIKNEHEFIGMGSAVDILEPAGRRAMLLPVSVA